MPLNVYRGVSNIRIAGAGMHQTILRNTHPPLQGPMMYLRGDNIEVSDLTFDGNRAGLLAQTQTTAAVSIYGNNASIRRVRATGFRGGAGEAFILAIYGEVANTIKTGALIEGCQVDDFTGYGTMIGLFGDPSAKISGTVRENHVYGCESIGLGCAGIVNSSFENNRVSGSHYGFNRDTFTTENVRVIDNEFHDCGQYGIVWWATSPGVSTKNDIISRNVITIAASRALDFTAIAVFASGDSSHRQLTITDNLALTENSDLGNPYGRWAYRIGAVTDGLLKGNRCSENMYNFVSGNTRGVFEENVYVTGTPIQETGTNPWGYPTNLAAPSDAKAAAPTDVPPVATENASPILQDRKN
jgi:hypothetical protein